LILPSWGLGSNMIGYHYNPYTSLNILQTSSYQENYDLARVETHGDILMIGIPFLRGVYPFILVTMGQGMNGNLNLGGRVQDLPPNHSQKPPQLT